MSRDWSEWELDILPAVGYLVSLFVGSYLRLAQEQIVRFSCADMLQCGCHGT